jgi:hypothetical protein
MPLCIQLRSRSQSLPAAIWRMRLTITSKIIAPVKETTRLKPCYGEQTPDGDFMISPQKHGKV